MAEEIEARAFAMFAEGATVNQVAEKLCNRYWAKAKKLRSAYDAQQGRATPVAAEPKKKRAAAEPEQDWDLQVTATVLQLEAIWAGASAAEKASAIQCVLQGRVDATTA